MTELRDMRHNSRLKQPVHPGAKLVSELRLPLFFFIKPFSSLNLVSSVLVLASKVL